MVFRASDARVNHFVDQVGKRTACWIDIGVRYAGVDTIDDHGRREVAGRAFIHIVRKSITVAIGWWRWWRLSVQRRCTQEKYRHPYGKQMS